MVWLLSDKASYVTGAAFPVSPSVGDLFRKRATVDAGTGDVTVRAQSNELDLANALSKVKGSSETGVGAAVALNLFVVTRCGQRSRTAPCSPAAGR